MESETASLESIALSEAETFIPETQPANGLRLSETYQENFRSYAPFLVSRRNIERYDSESEDDDRTMVSLPDGQTIMQRPSTTYNDLKVLVVALQKSNSQMYVFPDVRAFDTFKKNEGDRRKVRKISKSRHSNGQSIRSSPGEQPLRGRLPDSDLLTGISESGLPVLVVEVPHMSAFRPKTPYMIFRKYVKVRQSINSPPHGELTQFELSEFCAVKMKVFQHFKRYMFVFHPEEGPVFKVWAFQHNYRPFTDFNYKDTRFRVFGTSRSVSYPTFYNPELKLQVIDQDQSSLLDNLIEKKDEKNYRSGRKKHEVVDFGDLENPIPCPDNPIIKQVLENEYSSFLRNSVPQEMPPFGKFLAGSNSKGISMISKKYSEIGKIGVYQDPIEMEESNALSSSSTHLDSLVLSAVFLTLRETSLRSTVKRDELEIYQ
ncbi:hypothetical protein METBIDRAFT_40812 [Metschnikowia bicuspidata var. bicuspidata NRRL YB-4993]|uniref:Uncharacterized protein n=1 Tax=Metschnikowia bicuspidata var. bicuspidata NRRL YB-4993 TaxID=869754 RepID=A0A1A0HAG5_9ASCO|nr:hypothetical protein METBIDRAFT_40812 [Metschnikowia bicuspidata var. bicuspidata NRRL YB-4993]OBA20995.1 hypothetical protein METBIDRAFT_40812 [Metschnikowia bicuspidata var. bicuspidata NRRL YB-4993]